ncbi:MAG: hypothetical protein QME51_00580 [Planctomycetota bacterium]|nr:hypothetical protein [Planctomycetota bacterium]
MLTIKTNIHRSRMKKGVPNVSATLRTLTPVRAERVRAPWRFGATFGTGKDAIKN